ncbi:hypothetical protein EDD15DRAFT_2370953 [Pisolithus albus]|nr:hypothetical protein EDD15DRAFT_2370953 [Pisolithus albus]
MKFLYFFSVVFVLPVALTSSAPVGFGRVIPVYVFHDAARSRTTTGESVAQTAEAPAIDAGDPTGLWLERIVKSVKPVRYFTDVYAEVTVYVQRLPNSTG